MIRVNPKTYRKHLIPDLLAGATGAIAGAPQAMAFAIIAGISPVYGLYTAIVSTLVGSLVQSSTFMTIGPTNALALAVGSTLIEYQDGSVIERLVTLTLLVGVFQFLFGVLKLGNITRFVSNAVMTGFITGAAVLVMLGQVAHLTGYEGHVSGGILPRTWDWLSHPGASHWQTTLIGLTATFIIYRLHKTRFKSIATMTAIVTTGVFIALVGWTDVPLVRDMSAIPNQLPPFTIPNLSYVPDMLSAALAIAVLALVQSTGISEKVRQPDGSRPNISQDFIGQGAANVAGSFFYNMPSGGSLSRTAVNIAAGAHTRMSNIYAGLMVALILLLAGNLTEQIALAALAGHLLVAASSLINVAEIRMVWRVSRSAKLVMATTFIATLVLPLQYSIYIGVGLSLSLYLYTSSSRLRIVRLVPAEDNHFHETTVPQEIPAEAPLLISVTGNLHFAAITSLERILPHPNGKRNPVVIIRLRGNEYLGSTGIHVLHRYAAELQEAGGKLMLCGVEPRVLRQLRMTGELEWLGEENVFPATDTMLMATETAFKTACEWLHDQQGSQSTADS